MMYKCPKCNNTSEQAGNCPTCNVLMVEVKEEETATPDPSVPSSAPDAKLE